MDIEKLKALALAATQGPWMRLFGERTVYDRMEDGCRGNAIVRADVAFNNHDASNLDFIAAANPAAVLDLIAEVERLRAATQPAPIPEGLTPILLADAACCIEYPQDVATSKKRAVVKELIAIATEMQRAEKVAGTALTDEAKDAARQVVNWLRANANAEKDPAKRSAFIEAHNAALAIIEGRAHINAGQAGKEQE